MRKSGEAVNRGDLINEIATQTKLELVPKQGLCSCAALTSFFKAQATPKQIRQAAPKIAAAVAKTLGDRKKDGGQKAEMTAIKAAVKQ